MTHKVYDYTAPLTQLPPFTIRRGYLIKPVSNQTVEHSCAWSQWMVTMSEQEWRKTITAHWTGFQ